MTWVCIWPTDRAVLVVAGYQKPKSGALLLGLSSVMRSVLMSDAVAGFGAVREMFAAEWTITAGPQQVKQSAV